jgi:hypothetical protein
LAETRDGAPAQSTGRGFGRVLVAVYGLFALAASARSAVQIATRFHEAPLAYLLSAFAAVVYIVATVSLARGDGVDRVRQRLRVRTPGAAARRPVVAVSHPLTRPVPWAGAVPHLAHRYQRMLAFPREGEFGELKGT